jgi:FtsZ-interacting cell division protein ZipA
MAWLRPILLLAGALFIALLIWWERRRPRQAPESPPMRAERSEPVLNPAATTSPEQDTLASMESAPPERADTRDRDMHRTPPVIDWSGHAPAAPDAWEVIAVDPVAAGPQPELIVDWPAEDARRIVTLRILPARQDRLAGRALRQGLAACGFRHGQFGIFHLAGDDGRVYISAASLVRPGMLDPATMDFQSFAGINVFAVLPGPVSPEVALQRLGQVAVEVAARVGGRVQDENSAPFSAGEAGQWRQRCLSAIEGAQTAARRAD